MILKTFNYDLLYFPTERDLSQKRYESLLIHDIDQCWSSEFSQHELLSKKKSNQYVELNEQYTNEIDDPTTPPTEPAPVPGQEPPGTTPPAREEPPETMPPAIVSP